MLSEARLDELESKYGRIGSVVFSGHTVVFRRPTREIARDYRRKRESDAERPDAMDQLGQACIIAFDDIDDPAAARVKFTTQFLEQYPLAMGNPRFHTCLSLLSGLVEDEDAQDLGKGVSVRPAVPRISPEASMNGSAASSTTVL